MSHVGVFQSHPSIQQVVVARQVQQVACIPSQTQSIFDHGIKFLKKYERTVYLRLTDADFQLVDDESVRSGGILGADRLVKLFGFRGV